MHEPANLEELQQQLNDIDTKLAKLKYDIPESPTISELQQQVTELYTEFEKLKNAAPKPKISVTAKIGDLNPISITDNYVIEAEVGTPVVFNVFFEMGVAKLTAVKVTSTIDKKTFAMIDTTLNEGLFNGGDKTFEFTYKTNIGNSNEIIVFSTTDKKGSTATFTVVIKAKEIEIPEVEYAYVTKEIILGAQKNATIGHFYSFLLGKILTISASKSAPELIDFAYYYGATNKACIASPNDSQNKQIFASLTLKNTTKFAKVTIVGANKTNHEEWYDTALNMEPTETKASQLEKGDIYIFETQEGEKGAFYVDSIEPNNTGTITITLIKKNEK